MGYVPVKVEKQKKHVTNISLKSETSGLRKYMHDAKRGRQASGESYSSRRGRRKKAAPLPHAFVLLFAPSRSSGTGKVPPV